MSIFRVYLSLATQRPLLDYEMIPEKQNTATEDYQLHRKRPESCEKSNENVGSK